MDRFLLLIDSLENIRFNLNYDYKSLNGWNNESLILSGFSRADAVEQDESALEVGIYMWSIDDSCLLFD